MSAAGELNQNPFLKTLLIMISILQPAGRIILRNMLEIPAIRLFHSKYPIAIDSYFLKSFRCQAKSSGSSYPVADFVKQVFALALDCDQIQRIPGYDAHSRNFPIRTDFLDHTGDRNLFVHFQPPIIQHRFCVLSA